MLLYEALFSGALVFSDKIYTQVTNPFIDEKHLRYYDRGNFEQLLTLIPYYLEHTLEREQIGVKGQEFVLENKFVETSGFMNFLAKAVGAWILNTEKKKISKFIINETWVVRQFENDYNPIHWHSGHVSGVGYLKVPKILGQESKDGKKTYKNGKIELVHGAKMFLQRSTFSVLPEVGSFYFFPNYMMHTVYPFTDSDEERRSISFNAKIDDNIYDAYGNY